MYFVLQLSPVVEKNLIGAVCFTEKKGIIVLPIDVVVLSSWERKKQFVKAYRHLILLAAYPVPALSECLSFQCVEEKSTCFIGAHWYIKLLRPGWRRGLACR